MTATKKKQKRMQRRTPKRVTPERIMQLAWGYAPRDKRTAVQVATSVVLAAILVVAVVLRTHSLKG